MYLRLINVKAIERQRDSYILVINNRYEKMGESLYRINKDALEIIRNLNGTKTFDDLVDMMISCHLEKKEQARSAWDTDVGCISTGSILFKRNRLSYFSFFCSSFRMYSSSGKFYNNRFDSER